MSASTGPRSFAPHRLLALLAALLLLGTLVPTGAGAQVADGAVEISVDGLDQVVVGTPSPLTVQVRVRARGTVRSDTPLRLVGTLSDAEGAAVTLVTAEGEQELELADDGSFVFPSEDHAPLTLAGNPELLARGGFTADMHLTVPDGAERALAIELAASNERSAQVLRRFGSERAATAADISAKTFNAGVDVAYVARADAFPDALAGGPSAGLANAPILLTYPTASRRRP